MRAELLEDRRLLANVTVSNLNDVVNGNTASVAALISSPGDDGISLREAVLAANADAAADVIDFAVAGAIRLTDVGHAGEIVINNDLTINGPGASVLILRAFTGTAAKGDGARIFNVADGNFTADKTVAISGLTLSEGDSSARGGAILSLENLTLTRCTITHSTSANEGGALHQTFGTLTVTASTISGNTALRGGGIFVSGGSANLRDSTINDNTATATSGNGGGGIAVGSSGLFESITITNCTISGNQANSNGGGILNASPQSFGISSLTVRHSTITDNRADADNSGVGEGGGINSTFSDATAIDHTIVAGNFRSASARSDLGGLAIVARHSLIGDNTGASITNNGGNQIGTGAARMNPMLGPLADNGGPTLTHALLDGSPAIDAGDPAVPTPPASEQRGTPFVRVFDGDAAGGARVDVGAYERQALPGAFFVVDTLNDENDGNFSSGDRSLREAIGLAFGSVGPETITFAGPLTSGGPAAIVLTHGELAIRDALTITGPGSGLLSIDASGNDLTTHLDNADGSRVFNVDNFETATSATVAISGLTLTGGDSSTEGGAIRNTESLTITSAAINDNSSGRNGGGVFNSGSLVISASTVSNNSSPLSGGGIDSIGALTINASTISGNTVLGGHTGGGVRTVGGTLEINASSISGNASATGGGIATTSNAVAVIRDSTISGNSADGLFGGGGIFNGESTMTVINSTISGNLSHEFGGGISNFNTGSLTVRHSTITLNRADVNNDGGGRGGGIASDGASTTSTDHTIVAGNLRPVAVHDDMGGGGTVAARFSLIGDNFGATITDNGGNLIGNGASPINPQLGPLANNGGPTKTHAPMAGSPAINVGNPAVAAGVGDVPLFDQRGAPLARVSGGRIDIGAFESPLTGVSADFDGDADVDGADFLRWQRGLGLTGGPPRAAGNADGDGDVDAGDLAVWRDQYGSPQAAAAVQSISIAPTQRPLLFVEGSGPEDRRREALNAIFATGDFTWLFSSSESSLREKRRPWRR